MKFQSGKLVAATFRALVVLDRLTRLGLRRLLAGLWDRGRWDDARARLTDVTGHRLWHRLPRLRWLSGLHWIRLRCGRGRDGEKFFVETHGAGF